MTDTTHNGDEQFQLGEAAAENAADDGGLPIDMVEQPVPSDALKAVEDAPAGDVLITLSCVDGEIRMQQMLSVEKPDMGNPAHFFGQWFSRNYAMLVQMASVEFNLNQALREERAKGRLRLVSADGQTPLVP